MAPHALETVKRDAGYAALPKTEKSKWLLCTKVIFLYIKLAYKPWKKFWKWILKYTFIRYLYKRERKRRN